MKTPEERGAFGAWLVEQRQALGAHRGRKVLQAEVVRELAEAGWPIEESYYRALEGGSKRPGRELQQRLAAFFGTAPPDVRKNEPTELATAIREQTLAISELVQTVRLLLAAQLGGNEAALREEVARLVPGAVPARGLGAPQPGTQP